MKKYWQLIGVVAILAGIIYYPAMKLYQLVTKQRGEAADDEQVHWKIFNPAYRGKFKSHAHNGDTNIA